MKTTQTTRKYHVAAPGKKPVTVAVTGAYRTDQEWRDAAAQVAGEPDIDTSFEGERVIRLFPWWLQ